MNNDTTQDRQDDAVRAEIKAIAMEATEPSTLNRNATPIERLEWQIKFTAGEQSRVKREYVKACEGMARNIAEAGQHAKAGHYISETVMSSSLAADIPKYAIEYRALGEALSALRFILADLQEVQQ